MPAGPRQASIIPPSLPDAAMQSATSALQFTSAWQALHSALQLLASSVATQLAHAPGCAVE